MGVQLVGESRVFGDLRAGLGACGGEVQPGSTPIDQIGNRLLLPLQLNGYPRQRAQSTPSWALLAATGSARVAMSAGQEPFSMYQRSTAELIVARL